MTTRAEYLKNVFVELRTDMPNFNVNLNGFISWMYFLYKSNLKKIMPGRKPMDIYVWKKGFFVNVDNSVVYKECKSLLKEYKVKKSWVPKEKLQ